jgi:hypothetical protein
LREAAQPAWSARPFIAFFELSTRGLAASRNGVWLAQNLIQRFGEGHKLVASSRYCGSRRKAVDSDRKKHDEFASNFCDDACFGDAKPGLD